MMGDLMLFAALAILIGAPSFVAGGVAAGFHELRRLDIRDEESRGQGG